MIGRQATRTILPSKGDVLKLPLKLANNDLSRAEIVAQTRMWCVQQRAFWTDVARGDANQGASHAPAVIALIDTMLAELDELATRPGFGPP